MPHPPSDPSAGGAVSRRDVLRVLALSAAAPTLLAACRTGDPAAAHHAAHRLTGELAPAVGTEPGFFTAHEFATAQRLADWTIPADASGPAASEAGVVEFIDHVMQDRLLGDPADRQTAMRGGLAWVDAQCRRAHGAAFVDSTEAQQRALLDRIAYPDDAAPGDAAGVAFFNRFRDYVAMGYFSSPAGVEAIGYQGNVAVSEWTGCPDAADAHALRAI